MEKKIPIPDTTSTSTASSKVVYSGPEETHRASEDFPEEPIGARLILEMIDTLDIEAVPTNLIGGAPSYRKKGSNILLTEDQIKAMKDELRVNIQPAGVVAIGAGCSPWLTGSIQVGDIVRVFLNQVESSVQVQGKTYSIYPERCIISKMK